jgi:hypothetical protein
MQDSDNSSDPFVTATIDGKVGVWPRGTAKAGAEVEKRVVKNSLNPYFGQVYEWKAVSLPGAGSLQVEVHDDDLIGTDLIGTTTIDLEDRYFAKEWRKLGEPVGGPASTVKSSSDSKSAASRNASGRVVRGGGVVRKPLEHRDLFSPSSKVTQGALEMWVEIFPAADQSRYPLIDIEPTPKVGFELRVVVWNAKNVRAGDTIGGMNDLYITGVLVYRDQNNKLVEKNLTTDTHFRAKNGKGNFNYRLIYKDLQVRNSFLM